MFINVHRAVVQFHCSLTARMFITCGCSYDICQVWRTVRLLECPSETKRFLLHSKWVQTCQF